MSVFSRETENFVVELDAGVEAHLEWSRRVLRCAVLRESPGEDVLALDAQLRCRLGRCCSQHRERFEQMDPVAAVRMLEQHELMHDAVRSLCVDILAHGRGKAADLETFERTQSALLATLAHFKTEVLARGARQDELTGLPLRHGLEIEFERCRSTAQRHGEVLVLALIDVDHFKQVNDTHGHTVGDQALRHVAALLREHARAGEPVFRYGGEEFLLLLQAEGIAAAERAVDRLLQALRDRPMPVPDGRILSLRVSAGLAKLGPKEGMAQAVERADHALYAAKSAGRDRWAWAQP